MKTSSNIIKSIVIAVTTFMFSASLSADGQVKHVFELFTSQGCYSCPPADELLGKIIEDNEDILGLEFHVDYWDTLVYGSAGMWKDPFSSSAYSKRQRDYNRLPLAGRSGVYTPQIVVNGDYAFVGSNARNAKKQIKRKSGWVLDASVAYSDDGHLNITVDGEYKTNADIWLVTYEKFHATDVSSGENKGKVMNNFNVVREFESVGKWEGKPISFEVTFKELDQNQNCAVIVQEYDDRRKTISGPILGAGVCSRT